MTRKSQQLGVEDSGCQICVSLAAPDETGLMGGLSAAAGADLIEVRLDALAEPGACRDEFFNALRSESPAPIGFTCRPEWEGGSFQGTEEERRQLLETAAQSGAAFIDVEQDADWAEAFIAGTAVPVILSHHWQSPRPADLEERARRMRAVRPAIAKLVAPAVTPADAIPILAAGADLVASGQPAAAFCIGVAGSSSRVLAVAQGAALIYAAQPIGDAVAEGQWRVEALRDELLLKRWRPGFGCCALTGDPVDHSLSPAIFNAAFDALKQPMGYFPIAYSELEPALELAEAQGLRGLSVTMPFKQAAVQYCTELDPLAVAIGAINTMVADSSGWRGYNTDAGAIVSALSDVCEISGSRVAIFGAGGAARAAAFALSARGAVITLCNRTRARADDLAQQVGGQSAPTDTLESDHYDIIINATPIGMRGRDRREDEPRTPFPVEWLTGDEVVFDLVYRPRETPLLRHAAEIGCIVVEGLEMFIRQAAEQYRLWAGGECVAPLDIMRRAAEKALQRG
jgi:3-dehydroquinate dehydratase/shikimate dehydrogenase